MGLLDFGKGMAKRTLDMIYMLDVSGSMSDNIGELNLAMHALEKELKVEAAKNPSVQVRIRIITFGEDGAKWYMPNFVNAEVFQFRDITSVYGGTPMADAIKLASNAIADSKMPEKSRRPVLVILSDGYPDSAAACEQAIDKLNNQYWGKKAVKVAMAIGVGADKDMLAKFTEDPKKVLVTNDVSKISEFIKWTSTLVRNDTDASDMHIAFKAPNSTVKSDGDF